MKAMLALLGCLAISSTVFAGTKDLKIMNKLTAIGLTPEGGMSQIHVAIRSPDCGESMRTGVVECTGIDMGANEGQEAPITIKGAKAKELMVLLFDIGAMGDEGKGNSYMSAELIDCQQSNSGVADGSAATRTSCTIQIEPQQ